MRRLKMSKKIKYLNDKGTTMLETLMAFLVLTVIMGVLFGIIAFCSELRMTAADTNRAMELFSREVYNSSTEASAYITTKECKNTYKKISDGTSSSYVSFFYLEMSDKTDDRNKTVKQLQVEPHEIAMKDLKAKTYVYSDSDYKGIVPKVIRFIHAKDWSNESGE